MLRLKLYPDQFWQLMNYLRVLTDGQSALPLVYQSVRGLVLEGYLDTWRRHPHRWLVWQTRWTRPDARRYSLCLPLGVAKALYDDMQESTLSLPQQGLLDTLDQAMVDYQTAPTHEFI